MKAPVETKNDSSSFCTNLQAAGITKPIPHINPSIAEEALEQLKTKVTSLDRELQDLKVKVCKLVYS